MKWHVTLKTVYSFLGNKMSHNISYTVLQATFEKVDVHNEFTDDCKLLHHCFDQTYSQDYFCHFFDCKSKQSDKSYLFQGAHL